MNAIEIRNLTKTYKNFRLDNISLTLPNGCIMGLVGENGAGKTTTIKLILEMIHKESGSITVLGNNNIQYCKNDVGVVLDEVGIPDMLSAQQVGNVMRNIYKNWDDKAYDTYLEKLEIPKKLKFKEFSRGMKMKLGFAIALSHHAKLLILDEATSGLDPLAREQILDILFEFTRDENHSVLISSHIVSDLEKICDYITFLHKGKIMLCEEKDVLYEQYGLVRCTPEKFKTIDEAAIIGIRESHYGMEVLVKKNMIQNDMYVAPVGVEDVFIFMAKEM